MLTSWLRFLWRIVKKHACLSYLKVVRQLVPITLLCWSHSGFGILSRTFKSKRLDLDSKSDRIWGPQRTVHFGSDYGIRRKSLINHAVRIVLWVNRAVTFMFSSHLTNNKAAVVYNEQFVSDIFYHFSITHSNVTKIRDPNLFSWKCYFWDVKVGLIPG